MGLDPRFHCVGPYCLRWAALVPIPLSMDPTSPTEEVAVVRMIALGIGNPSAKEGTALVYWTIAGRVYIHALH